MTTNTAPHARRLPTPPAVELGHLERAVRSGRSVDPAADRARIAEIRNGDAALNMGLAQYHAAAERYEVAVYNPLGQVHIGSGRFRNRADAETFLAVRGAEWPAAWPTV